MRVAIESQLSCHAEVAWNEVLTSRLLAEVAAPLVTFRGTPGKQLPERWRAGETIQCRPYLFSFIPLSTRTLHFERIDSAARELQTRESDRLVRQWDHLISINEAGEQRCQYRDEIEIKAGWLTPMVWLFAQVFYRHRQSRWRMVAERLEQGSFVDVSSRFLAV